MSGGSGIAELERAAGKLATSADSDLRRLGDAIRCYLSGSGTLDEAVRLEFGIRDNNERFEVRRDRRNHVLAIAASLLPPGSHRDHARELLRMAGGPIPSSAPAEVRDGVQALRREPLRPNQLTEILRRSHGL